MAAPKKRKIKLEDEGDDDSMVGSRSDVDEFGFKFGDDIPDATVKKPVKRRRAPKKKKVPIRIPREDLWVKLPGELRSRIYELALPVDERVNIRDCRVPDERAKIRSKPLKALRWCEPGLLGVSKQIRAECYSLYYAGNRFKVFAKPEELAKVEDFLVGKITNGGNGVPMDHDVYVISAQWHDMGHWLHLARLAYQTVGITRHQWIPVVGQYNVYVQAAVEEVAKLGFKAHWRDLEMEELREDFLEWAEAKLKLLHKSSRGTAGFVHECLVEEFGTDVLQKRLRV